MKSLLCIFFSVLIFSSNLAQIHSTESKSFNFGNSGISSYKFNSDQNTSINFSIGSYLKEAGLNLQKAGKYYTIMPNWALDAISKEENPYGIFFLGFVVLPIHLTITRTIAELSSPYYFGAAGEKLISASETNFVGSARIQKVGIKLKNYRKIGYFSGALTASGISLLSYSLITAATGGETKENLVKAGITSLAIGRILRLIPINYAASAGKEFIASSSIFTSDRQKNLVKKAGQNLKSYGTWSYVGTGLQGLGLLMALSNSDSNTRAIGITTFIASWIIFDAIGAHAVKSAGERLRELGEALQ